MESMGNELKYKPKVFVSRRILKPAYDMLKERYTVTSWNHEHTCPRDFFLKSVEDVDGLYSTYTDRIDDEVLEHGKKLKVIATLSVGYDHINVAACSRRGILLAHAPDVQTESCAEFAMAMILCVTRRVIEADKAVHDGKWIESWSPTYMLGHGLRGSTVGIIGMGKIGQSLAQKLVPFLPKEILYHNRNPRKQCDDLGATYVDNLDELLRKSDFVLACLAMSKNNVKMFNAEKFALMKPTAQFFNFSRGGLVDQDALFDALNEKRILAAAADVCTPEPMPADHKLLTLPNFMLMPHISSATLETRIEMTSLVSKNIIAGLETRKLITPVPIDHERFPAA